MKKWCAIQGIVFALVPALWGQGDLYPPGPPEPTMKTLSQVEPRIPISSAPYDITAPGSYYLTTNLTSSSYGIRVGSDRVTVDLAGYSISGSDASSTFGVHIDGALSFPRRYVVVKNGMISSFQIGVYGEYVEGCCLEDLTIASNTTRGIWIHGSGNRVEDCTIAYNDDHGIYLSPAGGESTGNIIRRCLVGGNGLTNSSAAGIELDGTASGSCSANRIEDCLVVGNAGVGITLNGFGGRSSGNVVSGCSLIDNGDPAIFLNYASDNRIEGNHIVATTTSDSAMGIRSVSGTNNFIFANSSAGYPGGMSLSPNDVYGPVVTNFGELSVTGAAAHPWANFVR